MDGLRIIPVSNMELVYSVTAVADEIWREHFIPIIGEAQVDYMLEKFLSPEALVELQELFKKGIKIQMEQERKNLKAIKDYHISLLKKLKKRIDSLI